ncbi:hypothetical protein AGOR_G00196780 [Albula goreensis]|uniref:Ig-like domain-containing protein n=1 Tax=Albula goreensis TaxID=1534307 RepID=A0A8T3CQ44_9TELE|nr:hypothetical protein AGOR_G00196780 [Albula goreensis]
MQANRAVALMLLCPMMILQSQSGRTQPVLTLDPDWPQIFTGERITLRSLPRATLTVEPKWSPLYTGETVTLKCEVDSHSNWKYVWYKDWSSLALSQTAGHSVSGDRYSITAAAGSDQGQYWCEGRLEGRKVTSQRSDPITLTVKVLPKANLTVEPKWSPLYTGDNITLKCEVDSPGNWMYVWYKDQLQTAVSQTAGHSVSGDRYSITAAAGSDQGQYWCEGRLEGRNRTSQRSDPITLTVKDQSIITLAIALGAVAALIVSVLILIFFVKRRRSREDQGVCSSLVLDDKKKKKKQKKNTEGIFSEVVYSTVRTG